MTNILDSEERIFQELSTAVKKAVKLPQGYEVSFEKSVFDEPGRRFLLITVRRSASTNRDIRTLPEVVVMDGVLQKVRFVKGASLPFPCSIEEHAKHIVQELEREGTSGGW
jgi:hypothetical protein